MTLSEFIIFHALMIGASAHSGQGNNLWNSTQKRKKRRRLSQAISFDGWMKEWRFKEIKGLVSEVASAPDLKGVDDWWRMKKRIDNFNQRRRELLKGCHAFVFDESMSSYVPR